MFSLESPGPISRLAGETRTNEQVLSIAHVWASVGVSEGGSGVIRVGQTFTPFASRTLSMPWRIADAWRMFPVAEDVGGSELIILRPADGSGEVKSAGRLVEHGSPNRSGVRIARQSKKAACDGGVRRRKWRRTALQTVVRWNFLRAMAHHLPPAGSKGAKSQVLGGLPQPASL